MTEKKSWEIEFCDWKDKYNGEIKDLIELFEEEVIAEKKLRSLWEIYCVTERAWDENLNRFKDKRQIDYLLLTEAPPWSFKNYFYNLDGEIVPLYKNVCATFFGKGCKLTRKEALEKLAEKNFLLIDTIPFAMNYSKPNRRTANKMTRKLYGNLLLKRDKNENICKSYLLAKLEVLKDKGFSYKNAKVALAYKTHGTEMQSIFANRDLPIRLKENSIIKKIIGGGQKIIAGGYCGRSVCPARLMEIYFTDDCDPMKIAKNLE